jgi:hypothetical protein
MRGTSVCLHIKRRLEEQEANDERRNDVMKGFTYFYRNVALLVYLNYVG